MLFRSVLCPLLLLLPLLPLLPLVLLLPSTVVPLHHVSSSSHPTPSAFAHLPLVLALGEAPAPAPAQPGPVGEHATPWAVVLASQRCFELAVEGESLEAPVGEEEEEEDDVRTAVLAVRSRCLAPGEGPGGQWTAEWGAARWAYAEAH